MDTVLTVLSYQIHRHEDIKPTGTKFHEIRPSYSMTDFDDNVLYGTAHGQL
jgi:hypothetical protein